MPKARILWSPVNTERREQLEREITELLEQGYQVVAMSQDGDQDGSYVTVLMVGE